MKEVQFLKSHERLILVTFGLIALLLLGNGWINHSADLANTKAILAQQALQEQIKKNDDIAKTVQEQAAQYQTLVQTLTAQNQSLANAVIARNAAVQKQQTVDKTLPLPELGKRWVTLIGVTDADIQNVNGNLVVDDTASRSTVVQLETIPVLQQNLKDEQTTVANKDSQLAGLQTVNTGLTQQVDGLKVQLTDETTACKTDVANIKAQARKRERSWFVKGLVVGGSVVAYFLHAKI